MESEQKHVKFRITKWVFLAISILLNSFVVFYSCLDGPTTNRWNKFFTQIYTNIINGITHKETINVPLNGINVRLSSAEENKYNAIPGYKLKEIPLGSAKEIRCDFTPNDASDQAIKYVANPSDHVRLDQNGAVLSVVGLKKGTVNISGISSDGNFISSLTVDVIDRVTPKSFKVSLPKTEIPIGEYATFQFDIDGGPLGHNELINSRYYNTKNLVFSSSDESIAKVDNNGVIHSINPGNAQITVSNNDDIEEVFPITILPGSIPPLYDDLHIVGDDFCYENEMILDQSTGKNRHLLKIFDGETELDSSDFIFESSDELSVMVDRFGNVRGFRKLVTDDINVTIKATHKVTGQTVQKSITLKNELPNKMTVLVNFNDKSYYNPESVIVCEGDLVKVNILVSPNGQNKNMIVTCDNESIVETSNEGFSYLIYLKQTGNVSFLVKSEANPLLERTFKLEIIPKGSITTDDINTVTHSLRKIFGHAFIFAITQVFTLLTFYMFLHDKKWFIYLITSILSGFLLSGISELIQSFIPTRGAGFIDVLIDSSGVLFAALIIMLIIYLIGKKRN